MARPSKFTQEIANEICERISEGESLREICKSDKMPGRTTVGEWLESNNDFRSKYARARELQGDHMDDKILTAANDCLKGTIDPQCARVAIMAYQWRASKLAPKKYGEKIEHEVSGAVDVSVVIGGNVKADG